MTPEEADNLEEGAKLHLKYTMNGKLDVKVEYMFDEEKQETEVSFDSIPAVFPTPVGVFSFTKNDSVPPLEEDMNLVAYVNSPTDVTESYVENLSVEPTSKTTTIAAISLQNTVKQRGIDFILKSATKPLNVLIAFTRPLITEFADNLNLKHPLLPTISPYPTM